MTFPAELLPRCWGQWRILGNVCTACPAGYTCGLYCIAPHSRRDVVTAQYVERLTDADRLLLAAWVQIVTEHWGEWAPEEAKDE